MSSKDKMNVQDQSKERGVSGGLELSEEKDSSPGKPAALLTVWPEVLHTLWMHIIVLIPKDAGSLFSESSTVSSPDTESVTTSTISPADKVQVMQHNPVTQ